MIKIFYFRDQFDESKEKAEICEEKSGGQKCCVSERYHISLQVGRLTLRGIAGSSVSLHVGPYHVR